MKHTPGPWKVVDASRCREIRTESFGNRICRLPRHDANAQLIALAPEMAEALQAIADLTQGTMATHVHAIAKNMLAKVSGK